MTKKIPPDDMHLWHTHTKDVKRKKKADRVVQTPPQPKRDVLKPQLSRRILEKRVTKEALQPLGRKEVRRVQIQAKLDLHDLNFEKAYETLERFLLSAQSRGIRHVLIITGKGNFSGTESLRSMLPYWLSQTPLRNLVSYLQHPARVEDGGQGAYYVGVKKRI